jgi:outer membrane lipase/esterase
VVVEIGSNDVINALNTFVGALLVGGDIGAAKTFAIDSVLKPAADETVVGINKLIDGGASTVLWANVTDLGLTPAIAITDKQLQGLELPSDLFKATATEFAETYNVEVKTQLQSQINSGAIVEFDLFQTLRDIVNGNVNGLNVSDTCVTPNIPPFACRKADNYLFWDGIHPTKAGHELFAEEAVDVLGRL